MVAFSDYMQMSWGQLCDFLLQFIKQTDFSDKNLVLNCHALRLELDCNIFLQLQWFFEQNDPVAVKLNPILVGKLIPELLERI